jgi:hypothetical protein
MCPVREAGDWSVYAGGAVAVRDSDGVSVEGCSFVANGGNHLLFSGRARACSVRECLFARSGDSAIVALGRAAMEDGTSDTCPVDLDISRNLAHDMGIWGKQQGFLYQALSARTRVSGNVAWNGPRAAVSFTDGYGGGHAVERNLFFNFVRETADHGLFNSWDRQPYVTRFRDGSTPSATPAESSISRNLLINGFRSVWPIDHDDGSAFYTDTHNVLVYGGYKSFLGNTKTAAANLYIFPDAFRKQFAADFCASVWEPDAGLEYWVNNTCIKLYGSQVYGGGIACNGPQPPVAVTGANKFFFAVGDPDEAIFLKCGQDELTLAQLQSLGFERMSTAQKLPDYASILLWARDLLGLEGGDGG